MKKIAFICVFLLLFFIYPNALVHCLKGKTCSAKPNIIFFLADDMGWNDAGWHNGDIYMPNLSKLATDGIILNQSYFLPLCSPSRSSLMTGYYAFRTGMQGAVISDSMPVGLPLKFRTMGEKLQNEGYATHLIGKWNLGFCSWEYTPTFRGFDSFFGFYEATAKYYNHTSFTHRSDPKAGHGYDFRNNSEVAWEYNGIHSSIPFVKQAKQIIDNHDSSAPLFIFFSSPYPHIPHEVPIQFEDIYTNSSVKNIYRRQFMARMSALDYDVGKVVSALKMHGLYENSVIAFTSDNGGSHDGGGNNNPLRGCKSTVYEGGTRVPGFFYSPLLSKKGFIYNGILHAVDWLPTFLGIAGGYPDSDLDGINMWPSIMNNLKSPRNEFVYNLINEEEDIRGAIRVDNWKLIIGHTGRFRNWYLPEETDGNFFSLYFEQHLLSNQTYNSPLELYNLSGDPHETTDLSDKYPNKVKSLLAHFKSYIRHSVPPFKPWHYSIGEPKHFGGVFSPGWCKPLFDAIDMNYDNI